MKTKIKRWILFLFLLIVSCFYLYSLEVYLKKNLIYSQTKLTVGDVAQIRGEDPHVINSLLNISLNINNEHLVLLPGWQIREIISKNYNGQIIVIGNRVLCINLTLIHRNNLYFYQNMLHYIDRIEANKQSRLEIEILTAPLLSENSSQAEYIFQISCNQYRNGYCIGKNRIYYKYFDKNRQQISGSMDVYIHQFLQVAAPLYDIKAGSLLKKEDLKFMEKDISLFNEDLLLEYSEYQTRLHLYKGDPIKLSALEKAYLVKSGDKITIIFLNGSLYVQLQGRALSSGIIDEQISVRSLSTNKEFNAVVSGYKEVLVEIK